MVRNSPKSVGMAPSATRRMNFSCFIRWRIRSATESIFRLWSFENSTSCGTRAMVPSWFMISQITPAGVSPARRARSTLASVCPARTSTPPSRARNGNMCPGRARSLARQAGSTVCRMVRVRSAAEIPVVTPSRASIDSQNAVPNMEVLVGLISGRRRESQRSGVSARQISPRPRTAMKLMISGVTFSAAIVRSPSFSRSSSSTTTTMRPARISWMASGTETKGIIHCIRGDLICALGTPLGMPPLPDSLDWKRMSQPLVGMDLTDLRAALGPDQPGYRARQIYEALYRGQAADLVAISTLPVGMRQELAERHALGLPTVDRLFESIDGTRRYLLRLGDGRTVETVLMPEGERDTICISSQVGCPVDCKFCMTALMGLERRWCRARLR